MKAQEYQVSVTPQDDCGMTVYTARTIDEKGNLRGQHGDTPQAAVDRLKISLSRGKEGVRIEVKLLPATQAHKPSPDINNFQNMTDMQTSSKELLAAAEGPIERRAVAKALMSVACKMQDFGMASQFRSISWAQ